jgi:two-component system sensor histidine kinase BaeS
MNPTKRRRIVTKRDADSGPIPVPNPSPATRSPPEDVQVGDPSPDEAASNDPRPQETFGTEFLDNVAHQMVAPLQSVLMHCQNIASGAVEAGTANRRLKEVIGHTNVLIDLAHRLRFLNDLVTGKKLNGETLPFASIVSVWIEGFNNYLPLIQERNFTSDIQHPRMNVLPEVHVNRLAAHQVVVNLYDNAIKYGAEGCPLRVTAWQDGSFVVNEFSHQTGVALTEQAAASMFQRGVRAKEAAARTAVGTGVGMWISRELMRSMHGDLVAFPSRDGLTRFHLRWRIAR